MLLSEHASTYSGMTLAEYLRVNKYSESFLTGYLLPMCAAVWSVPNVQVRVVAHEIVWCRGMRHGMCYLGVQVWHIMHGTLKSWCWDGSLQVLAFPVTMLVRFWANHHLLDLTQRPVWRVVKVGLPLRYFVTFSVQTELSQAHIALQMMKGRLHMLTSCLSLKRGFQRAAAAHQLLLVKHMPSIDASLFLLSVGTVPGVREEDPGGAAGRVRERGPALRDVQWRAGAGHGHRQRRLGRGAHRAV